jgi:hypothetical protein
MTTLYLHIGQTKTATTTLQAWCSANREALAQRGVLYPHAPAGDATPIQHRFLFHALHQGAEEQQRAWDFLHRQIDAAPGAQRVLVSEELFWHLFPRQPLRRRDAIGQIHHQLSRYSVRVVASLRRQDHWVESWHNQEVKALVSRASQMSLDDFVQEQEQAGLLDYDAVLADWIRAFGHDALRVSEFAPAKLYQQDPTADFLHRILGLDDPLTGFERVPSQQQALSHPALVFAQAFNRQPGADKHKAAHIRLLRQADLTLADRRRRLSATTANRLLQYCQAGNQRLADAFCLGGEPPALFRDWTPRDEGTPLPPQEPLASEMANLMAQQFIQQEARLGRLRHRLDELEARLAALAPPPLPPAD